MLSQWHARVLLGAMLSHLASKQMYWYPWLLQMAAIFKVAAYYGNPHGC